jgi:hypothetical protein
LAHTGVRLRTSGIRENRAIDGVSTIVSGICGQQVFGRRDAVQIGGELPLWKMASHRGSRLLQMVKAPDLK